MTPACRRAPRPLEGEDAMRISRFFIDRPIFAAVVSLVITIIGAIGYTGLGITQLPEIIPPTITVSTSYPGRQRADAWPTPSPRRSSRR